MDIRAEYETGDTATTRAFFTLFRRFANKDVFKFAVDTNDNLNQVEAMLRPNDAQYNQQTTVKIIAVNNEERYKQLQAECDKIGFTILDETDEVEHTESGHTAHINRLTATIKNNPNAKWNVPHLVVYGSLKPEIKEICQEQFGTTIRTQNIRNHYVLYGDNLHSGQYSSPKDTLAQGIIDSQSIFPDEKDSLASDVHTGYFV